MKVDYIKGLEFISSEIFKDKRGSFLSCYKEKEQKFNSIWLNRKISQINISFTKDKGSIRGLHYQEKPFEECKLIRCIKGKVWDVAVDLRKNSKTYRNWTAIELSESNTNAIFIPEGFAHGFQTLEDNCELLYMHSNNYEPAFEKGVRWNDPIINIAWPLDLTNLSERDFSLPYLEEL